MIRVHLPRILAVTFLFCLFFGAFDALAQNGQVSAGLEKAATEVKSSFKSVVKIMYAACLIVGVVGGLSVYSKWSASDPDFRKSAANWFGALIFAGLVVAVLEAVFS